MSDKFEQDREDLASGEWGKQWDREATEQEIADALEREQIIAAARRVNAGVDMLFAALRKEGVL